jgi:hypothetical protein
VGAFTRHYDESLFQPTAQGLYSVELLVTPGDLIIGANDFEMISHDNQDNDVEGAVITVTLEQSGGAVSRGTSISEKGGGRYVIGRLDIPGPGSGRLSVTVSRNNVADTAVFNIPDIKAK